MKYFVSFLSVSSLLLLGRLSGFLREWLMAFIGGADQTTDIAIVLITLPDLMVTLLIGGGFTAAIVPVLKRASPGEATKMYLQILVLCTAVFTGIALIVSVNSHGIMALLSPSLSVSTISNASPLFILVAFAIPMTAASGITQAHLVAHEKFWYGASGTLFFNSMVILALILAGHLGLLIAVAAGIIAGVTLRLLVQLAGLRSVWSSPSGAGSLLSRSFFRNFAITTFFAATMALIPVISRAFASDDQAGGLSLFSYAFRILELPVVLIYASLSTVLLPLISDSFQSGEHELTIQKLTLWIRFSLLSGFAILIPGIVFSLDFIHLLFSTTQLSKVQLTALSQLLIVGLMFLPFRGLLVLSLAIVSAIGQADKLLFVAVATLLSVFIISPLLLTYFGINGAMLGFGIAHVVGTLIVFRVFATTFGDTIIRNVFRDILAVFCLPILASVGICFLGSRFFDGVISSIVFSILSVLIFSLLTGVIDRDARKFFRTLLNGWQR